MPDRVLSEQTDQQLTAARRLLVDLQVELASVPATAEDAATLAESVRQLDELFLLVVVGEFNAGKSAFINALVGRAVLEEGVTPTTAQLHVIRYGETTSTEVLGSGIRVVTAPVDFLKDIHIVDTPGTNAIIREHERLTTEFVPRADFVLFVTSADRPFTETERAFVEAIRAWGKKVVVVLNKIDILERPGELEQVLTFVGDAAERVLGTRPPIFPVSARLAGRAKHGEPALWSASRFEALERFLHDSLDEESRFRLKLSSPLGVGDVLARRYLGVSDERLALLANDTSTLDDIERQLAQYRARPGPGIRVADERGREGAARDGDARTSLLRRHAAPGPRLRSGEPIARAAGVRTEGRRRRSRSRSNGASRRSSTGWSIRTTVSGRPSRRGSRLASGNTATGSSAAPTSAASTKNVRVCSIRSDAKSQRVVETYDRRREAEAIANGARTAVAATAAVGAGALGLGALVALVATTSAADITGIVMAGVMAALGFLIIPAKRRKARAEIRAKVSALTSDLRRALGAEFERAQERSAQRFADAMGPYTRFVRAERERWDTHRSSLTTLRGRIGQLLSSLGSATT